jgi:hypothetical protein
MKERLTLLIPFIDPRWLRAFRAQIHRQTKRDGQIVVHDVALKFPMNSAIPDFTEVEIILSGDGYFYAEPCAEVDARQAERIARAAEEKARSEAEEKRIRAEAQCFNQALGVPVRWSPSIKDVLSGLVEGSNGAGFNARTVIHILLDEPLAHHRLKRDSGDFLCTPAKGSNGKRWSNSSREDSVKVTCKTCLRLAQHWQRENTRVSDNRELK